MYNWSVDVKKFKNEKPEAYKIWELQQLINYGLGGGKLSKKLVIKYWDQLFMDPITRKYLQFLLWPKKSKS